MAENCINWDSEALFQLQIESKTKRFMMLDPKKGGCHPIHPTLLLPSKNWVSSGGLWGGGVDQNLIGGCINWKNNDFIGG